MFTEMFYHYIRRRRRKRRTGQQREADHFRYMETYSEFSLTVRTVQYN
jgi:hypothetical protein